MIVYHYLPAESALKALRDRRLKISHLSEIDDLLELSISELSDLKIKSILEGFKIELAYGAALLVFLGSIMILCYGATMLMAIAAFRWYLIFPITRQFRSTIDLSRSFEKLILSFNIVVLKKLI